MSAERIAIPEDEAERRRLQREKNQAAIDLIDGWLSEKDDPHNDAEIWPKVRAALNEGRPEGQKLFRD